MSISILTRKAAVVKQGSGDHLGYCTGLSFLSRGHKQRRFTLFKINEERYPGANNQ